MKFGEEVTVLCASKACTKAQESGVGGGRLRGVFHGPGDFEILATLNEHVHDCDCKSLTNSEKQLMNNILNSNNEEDLPLRLRLQQLLQEGRTGEVRTELAAVVAAKANPIKLEK